MGVMPVGKLLANMAIPMVISMLVQAMYNVVDSYFVAKISTDALTAISLAYPIQMLMIAVAIGTSVGMNSYMSRKLGEGNTEAASKGAKQRLVPAFAICNCICNIWVRNHSVFQAFHRRSAAHRNGR